jgi:hypothetical protein
MTEIAVKGKVYGMKLDYKNRLIARCNEDFWILEFDTTIKVVKREALS